MTLDTNSQRNTRQYVSTREILANFKPELLKISHKLRINAIKIIDKKKMVYKGLLRTGIQSKLILDDENPHIELYVNDPGNNKLKYAKYLHEGIKPHMPPIEPIKAWVIKKGIHKKAFEEAFDKQKNTGKKRKTNKIDLELKTASSIAWAIAVNMKKKGRKPTPFLKLAVKMTLNNE